MCNKWNNKALKRVEYWVESKKKWNVLRWTSVVSYRSISHLCDYVFSCILDGKSLVQDKFIDSIICLDSWQVYLMVPLWDNKQKQYLTYPDHSQHFDLIYQEANLWPVSLWTCIFIYAYMFKARMIINEKCLRRECSFINVSK